MHSKTAARGNKPVFKTSLDSPFRLRWYLITYYYRPVLSEQNYTNLITELSAIGNSKENITIGLNSICKILTRAVSNQDECPLQVIFACKEDAVPHVMHSQLLQLVAQCNNKQQVYIVALPKGAESTLCCLFGLKRVSVFGVKVVFKIAYIVRKMLKYCKKSAS